MSHYCLGPWQWARSAASLTWNWGIRGIRGIRGLGFQMCGHRRLARCFTETIRAALAGCKQLWRKYEEQYQVISSKNCAWRSDFCSFLDGWWRKETYWMNIDDPYIFSSGAEQGSIFKDFEVSIVQKHPWAMGLCQSEVVAAGHKLLVWPWGFVVLLEWGLKLGTKENLAQAQGWHVDMFERIVTLLLLVCNAYA